MALKKLLQEWAAHKAATLNEGKLWSADIYNLKLQYNKEKYYTAKTPVDSKLRKALAALGNMKIDAAYSGSDALTNENWVTYVNGECAIFVKNSGNRLYIVGLADNAKSAEKLDAALALEGLYDRDKQERQEKKEKRAEIADKKGLTVGSKAVFSGELCLISEITRSGKFVIRTRSGRTTTVTPNSVKPYDPSKGEKQFETPLSRKRKQFEDKLDKMGIASGTKVNVQLSDWEKQKYGSDSVVGVYTGRLDVYSYGVYVQVELPATNGVGATTTLTGIDMVSKV